MSCHTTSIKDNTFLACLLKSKTTKFQNVDVEFVYNLLMKTNVDSVNKSWGENCNEYVDFDPLMSIAEITEQYDLDTLYKALLFSFTQIQHYTYQTEYDSNMTCAILYDLRDQLMDDLIVELEKEYPYIDTKDIHKMPLYDKMPWGI